MYGNKDRTPRGNRSVLCFGERIGPYSRMIERAHWHALLASTPAEARRHLRDPDVHVGLFRFGPDPARTADFIAECQRERPDLAWIAIVDSDQMQQEAIREGIVRLCFDYLTTPLEPDLVRYAIGHAHGLSLLAARQTATPESGVHAFGILGEAPAIQTLRDQIQRVARSDAPVLLGGESGTGKELVARAIHAQSARRDQPFVALNMGALTDQLAQSELFGHERGAFSGAVLRHIGHIEIAHRGTLFLDEIGDLSPSIQTSLLRFLQERTIQRVGGTKTIEVDVRIIAATHVDLRQAVVDRRFREDLYFRLNVLNLTLPPLRERGQDVMLLAKHFLERFTAQSVSSARDFSPAAREALATHHWPGNVRELINRIQRATVMSRGPLITPADLELGVNMPKCAIQSLNEVRRTAETQAIQVALREANFNLSAAARTLGISRVTLYRLMDEYGLQREAQLRSVG